ncbi:MAG: potassium channel protein, partial [Sorangium cellulosum]
VYSLLGDGTWTFGEALYFAIITVSTVGFGEMHHLEHVPGARLLTGVLILVGSAALMYFQSNITATLVEGRLGKALRRKRMRSEIKELKDHIVVAGAGSTGRHVIEELVAVRKQFVVIDSNLKRIEQISFDLLDGKMLYVHGDATHDSTLREAGIERAFGIVAALTNDHENLYITLSVRSVNPSARIVAKVIEAEAKKKMLIAGANATVSPNIIGGQRLASELIRPDVIQFLDQIMRDRDKNLRFEEIPIPENSSLVGLTLREAPIRAHANVLVIAVRDTSGTFIYNPGPDFVLEVGSVLIVIAQTKDIHILREIVSGSIGRFG